jgi:hypothetical protein
MHATIKCLFGIALTFGLVSVANAQSTGTKRFYPPIDDQSLVNHQPWADSQLQNPNGYKVLTPSGVDDTTQLQAAFDNSRIVPVLLRSGPFKISQTIHLPTGGILVAENGLYYDKYRSPTANVEIQSTGGFRGSAYIACGKSLGWQGAAYNGDYCYIRGITVDANYQDTATFTGSISGTTLTVTGISGTLDPGQEINDGGVNVGSNAWIVSQIDGTPGGNGHYTLNYGQTVATPQTMNGPISCFQNQANASFTTLENIQANRCTGDGYRVIPDANQPGGQGFGNNVIIRPILQTSAFFNQNHGYGVYIDNANGGFASDIRFDNINTGSNIRGSQFLRGTTGQENSPRMEFDGRGVVVQQSGPIGFTNVVFDNEFGPFLTLNNESGVYIIGGASSIRSGNTATIGIDVFGTNVLYMSDFTIYLQYPFKIEAGSSLTGRLAIAPLPASQYPDALTESVIAPLIPRGAPSDNPPQLVTLTGATFAAPDLLISSNSVFNLSHAGCAGGTGGHCSIPNPSQSAIGNNNTLEIHQSLTGSDTITWGPAYVHPPTLSTGGAAVDYVPAYNSANGNVVLGTPVAVAANANLLALPLDFSGAGWTAVGSASVTSGQSDPEGGTGAILFKENTSTGHHAMQPTTPLSLAANTYTASFYFKPATGARFGSIGFTQTDSSQTNVGYRPDCSLIVLEGPDLVGYQCTVLASGYIRISLTIAAHTTVTDVEFFSSIYPTVSYTGDGVSTLDMWGPVLRQGTAP